MCTENYYWHHDYVRLAWDSGFTFNTHKAKTNYDWSNISLLDIDKVIRDRDVTVIEKHMGTVLKYCLDEEQTKILEPTFVKVFQLSQLSMQYLQFCKRYLDNTVVLLKKELGRHKEENTKLKKNAEELKQETSELSKKVNELKQSMQLIQSTPETFVPTSYKCNVCYKVFMNEDFLLSHVKRRHEIDNNPFQSETDRLQMEIKELKERLNSTEKFIQSDTNIKTVQQKQEIIPNNDAVIENAVYVDDLKDKFDHLKYYVEQELTILRNEKRYQEKYEKWFEMVFERLDSSKNELQGKQAVVSMTGDGDKLNRKESSTQTLAENCVESETMTDDPANVVSEENITVKPVVAEIDVEKIQNDIRINTESHFGQIQGVLEKKLSGGFEQMQSQMNTFWKKLSDMELEKKMNNISHVQYVEKRVPKPTTREDQAVVLSSDSSSSSISLRKSPVVKSQPIPAPRVVKQFPIIKKTNLREVKSQEFISTKRTSIVKPPVVELESSSEASSSSDGTVEIAKPPITVTPVKRATKFSDTKNKEVKPAFPAKYSRTFKKEIREIVDTESEDDESVSEPSPIKPSPSSMERRPSTGLKQKAKDEANKSWNRQIEEMLNSRLREIGISPHWKGIPEKSYQQAMRVIKHQTELAKRKYPKYYRIRDILIKIMNDRLNRQSRSSSKANFEGKKQSQGKIVVLKQATATKRHSKHRKQSKDSVANTNYQDTPQPKPKIRHVNETFKKESKKQEQTFQDRINLVGTPIKKKVIFDLEDTPITSKISQTKTDAIITQRQQIGNDEKPVKFERNLIASSPAKKDIDIKPVTQKPLRIFKINHGGSSSSLASSILELPKGKTMTVEKKTEEIKDDISDWDVSDILT